MSWSVRSLALLLAAFAALALPRPAAAQGPPPPQPGGPAAPGPDRSFLLVNVLRAIEGKAMILLDQGKTEAALEELRRAQTVEVPRESPAWEAKAHLISRLARTYAEAGKRKEALETTQRLLSDVPPGSVAEATAWVEAGATYRQLGMSDEALKAFDRAIELSEKLVRSPRGPAGRPGPPPGGRPMGQPPTGKGEPR